MSDWITGIVALLGGIGGLGGLCSIFLFYRENRQAKQIENDHNANNEVWALVKKYKEDVDAVKKEKDEAIREKDNKIDSLYNTIGELRKRNDKLSSTVAALRILRCKVVGCANRVPPMGSRESNGTDEEQNTNDKQE